MRRNRLNCGCRGLYDAGSDHSSDHVRRRGNTAVAGACRNSSSPRRPGIDLPAGACAHFRLRFVRAPDPHHYSADFRFVVAEQLRECRIEADIVLEPMRVRVIVLRPEPREDL